MIGKVFLFLGCMVLTLLFGGCADFEYSEPGVYGYYEPHYYYDRYPHYYHGAQMRGYVHQYRAAGRPPEHAEAGHEGAHDEGHGGTHR